jgi:hypothetical protein
VTDERTMKARFGSVEDTANGPSFPPAVAELVRPAKVQYSQLESNYGDAYSSHAYRQNIDRQLSMSRHELVA